MAVKKDGIQTLPFTPQIRVLAWNPETGESEERSWEGEPQQIESKYNEIIASAPSNNRLQSVVYENRKGRAVVREVWGRDGTQGGGLGLTQFEELVGVEVARDIWGAPDFRPGGALALTDDEVTEVLLAVEERLQENEIENFADWTPAQKELRYQLSHGSSTYIDHAFIFRRTVQSSGSSVVNASMNNIGRVVDEPVASSRMLQLINLLPAGEWLYKPPQVSLASGGVYKVDREWLWAKQHSIVYGGSFKRP
jgi:hypothetical protein